MVAPRQNSANHSRTAFSLIELLVVLGIIAIMIGLLLVGIQKVRATAQGLKCRNNLGQLALASHEYHDARGAFQPMLAYDDGYWANGFVRMLPYIEQTALHQEFLTRRRGSKDTSFYGEKVDTFLCPLDSTHQDGFVFDDVLSERWAVTSYSGNALVFAHTTAKTGQMINPAYARPVGDIRDGTSHTILFSDRLARCGNGGAYWALDQDHHSRPIYPTYPLSAFATKSLRAEAMFQVQPSEVECRPKVASSPHTGGIRASFADGSARFISKDIYPSTWWALLTPNGGESFLDPNLD